MLWALWCLAPRQIIDMITAEKNRLDFAMKPVQKGIAKHIRWLERQLASPESSSSGSARPPLTRIRYVG